MIDIGLMTDAASVPDALSRGSDVPVLIAGPPTRHGNLTYLIAADEDGSVTVQEEGEYPAVLWLQHNSSSSQSFCAAAGIASARSPCESGPVAY